MNTQLFSVNNSNAKWHKKIFRVSFIDLALGTIILLMVFILKSLNILTWFEKYPLGMIIISIVAAFLCGTWSGSAYVRKQIHFTIAFVATITFLVLIPLMNLLSSLLFVGLYLILFGLTALETLLCDEK